jgi:CheY-like chemotaxis protein
MEVFFSVSNSTEPVRVMLLGTDGVRLETISQQLVQTHPHYQITKSQSSEEAFKLLTEQHFHILVSELSLGNLNAIELVFELRKAQRYRTEVVLVSGDKNLSLHECHQVGIAHVLNLPLNLQGLSSAIDQLTPHSRRFGHSDLNSTFLKLIYGEFITKKAKLSNSEVSEIGRGGFFYTPTNNHFSGQIGQVVEFELTLGMVPNTHFKGLGIIRWNRYEGGQMGYGVEFISIPEDVEKILLIYTDLFKIQAYVPDNLNAA